MIVEYLRRWSVEVAYCDSKPLLGFHDPMVWSAKSVERAHPMAWFVGSLVVLGHASVGREEKQAERNRARQTGLVLLPLRLLGQTQEVQNSSL